MEPSVHGLLLPVQALATSGARAVEPFELGGDLLLAVPQLARDLPDGPAGMNGGDSSAPTRLFCWADGRFEPWADLPVGGGEDVEFFRIGARAFLAVASLRSGAGPYELNTESVIHEWTGSRWEPFQRVPSFAAKQWRHFAIGSRHFLALAQGIRMEGARATRSGESFILSWDGERFQPLQNVRSGWGYNWTHFQLDGAHWLGYADHVEPTGLLRWSGERFEWVQDLEATGGRALCAFTAEGAFWLAVAVLTGDSWLYRHREGRFERQQRLCGPGAREFCWVAHGDGGYLVQVNFITGPREAPETRQTSRVHALRAGRLEVVDEFTTWGGTDAAVFERDGQRYLAVANSLSGEVRFRTDTLIYRLALPAQP